MHDISRIKDLQLQQTSLTDRFGELDALLEELKSFRSEQAFIPEELNTSICTMLSDIKKDQHTFLSGYEALDFGTTPSTLTACRTELDDYENYIIEKATYVDVINFILSLDSDNASAKTALEQHKEFAADYDCRANSVQQCESDLKKYILLKKAYEEQDPTKRLSDIIELSPLIDFPLVVALNTNALVSHRDEPAAQPAQDAAVTADSPASAAPTYVEQPAPAPAPVPSYTVPQRPVSDRPVPDEAPVFHPGIENGLNTELSYVLSRERTAASLAADVEHTTAPSGERNAHSSQTVKDPWGEIGIYNPAAICYSVPDDRMQIFRCDKPKKFSVSDFQKEMSLKAKNRFQKQWAFKDAYRYGATSPLMLAALIKEDPDLVEDACDTLVDNGYLKAFELSGPAYSSFERLYVLTASGRKVFTNQETAALLNLAPVEKPATPPFASHANAVLNRQLFLKTKKLMEQYMPSRQFNVGSFILETNSFINFFQSTNGTGTYSYVSVLGNDPKDYLIFKIELQELLHTLDTVTVVGMTKEHARALAEWIWNCFSRELAGKKLQFYVHENNTYYSFPDEKTFIA
ncbi:MAG: hypothetical protein Q4B85_06380 [Lachnospiraceae bacterium]|nr:hypothetical protein [Lachnospiraceae bacterium]